MSLDSNNKLLEIVKEYKEYENQGILPKLSCPNDKDYTHMSLNVSSPDGEEVRLTCFTCGYSMKVGVVTGDYLKEMLLDTRKVV